MKLENHIEHTLLKQDATKEDFEKIEKRKMVFRFWGD